MVKTGNTIFWGVAFFVGMVVASILFVQFTTGRMEEVNLSERTTECVDFSMGNDSFEEENIANPCPLVFYEKHKKPNTDHCSLRLFDSYYASIWLPPKLG